jgi:hypothetical protein
LWRTANGWGSRHGESEREVGSVFKDSAVRVRILEKYCGPSYPHVQTQHTPKNTEKRRQPVFLPIKWKHPSRWDISVPDSGGAKSRGEWIQRKLFESLSPRGMLLLGCAKSGMPLFSFFSSKGH